MNQLESVLPALITLRHSLHMYPELANAEHATAERISRYLAGSRPHKVCTGLAGHGLAFIWEGAAPGPTIGFRAELDALPIQEQNAFAHRSLTEGISHKCGHDGHMAMIAGLASVIGTPKRGRLVLIFQPAEETGEGGPAYVEDPAFAALGLDEVYALHNLPDYPMGTVVVRSGPFTCASKGLTITLKGATAHAAFPEDGVSPALPMCRIIEALHQLPHDPQLADVFCRVTLVGSQLGEAAFGTAPGDAQIWATLRTDCDSAMDRLTKAALALVRREAEAGNLRFTTHFCDVFDVTRNHAESVARIVRAAQALQYPVVHLDEALRFSEDFGRFTQKVPGAMFGLGSGPGPKLHNEDYDFPDELIPIGLQLFQQIAVSLLA